jgi:hypothetical protein
MSTNVIITTRKQVEEYISWNWVGIAAGVLSILVASYNINQYYKELKKGKKK